MPVNLLVRKPIGTSTSVSSVLSPLYHLRSSKVQAGRFPRPHFWCLEESKISEDPLGRAAGQGAYGGTDAWRLTAGPVLCPSSFSGHSSIFKAVTVSLRSTDLLKVSEHFPAELSVGESAWDGITWAASPAAQKGPVPRVHGGASPGRVAF